MRVSTAIFLAALICTAACAAEPVRNEITTLRLAVANRQSALPLELVKCDISGGRIVNQTAIIAPGERSAFNVTLLGNFSDGQCYYSVEVVPRGAVIVEILWHYDADWMRIYYGISSSARYSSSVYVGDLTHALYVVGDARFGDTP